MKGKIRKRKAPGFSAPARHTTLEHHALCARMRAKRAERKVRTAATAQAELLSEFSAQLADEGVLRSNTELVTAAHRQDKRGWNVRKRCAFGLALAVRKCRAWGGGRERVFSSTALLRMAYEPAPRTRASVASHYGCSRQTVRRGICCVAGAYLAWQVHSLQRIWEFLRQHPPKFACASLAWDETAERLTLQPMAGATVAQGSSAWQVMICRLRFCWVVEGSAPHTLDVVLPPLPLVGTAARHMHNAWWGHPLMRDIMGFKELLLQSSKISIELLQCDGAAANMKLCHHWYNRYAERAPTRLPLQLWCRNHANNLIIVGLVVTCLGVDLVNSLYCCVLFLKMGGHFLRSCGVLARGCCASPPEPLASRTIARGCCASPWAVGA